jgi:hypothetical protein
MFSCVYSLLDAVKMCHNLLVTGGLGIFQITGGLWHIPNHRRLSGCTMYFYAPYYAVKFLQKRLTEGISEFVVISQKQVKIFNNKALLKTTSDYTESPDLYCRP